MDRRQFSLLALAAGLAAGVSACGRRGPLEPPPYTEQGREWNRRQGRNPDGSRREPGQRQQAEGSVREGLRQDAEQRGTVDVEANVEGRGRTPSDPTQPENTVAPGVSPQGARRRPPGVIPPKGPFILDPLLE